MLKKTDNSGLLIPGGPGGGSTVVIDSLLEDEVYDKLLYFLFARMDIGQNSPVFLNGEIVGYAVTPIPKGSPLVYAELVPSSWEMLWSRSRELLGRRDYGEYPFQCVELRLIGDRIGCIQPGSSKPVFIDREASRKQLGVDPLEAGTPRFIGNIVSPPNPSGLSGIYSYTPELIPYLAYLYRLTGYG